MNSEKKQKGFALVFVIAVVAALSLMTGSMFFYYDTDLKSVSRNSVMQQVNLAAETGLQEGQRWITEQLNSNSFTLVDIQNELNIEDSDNQCLNRHGYTDTDEDVYYAQRIQGLLGDDEAKFEEMSYEVFVMRHADVVRSIYFQGVDARNSSVGTDYQDRSFALVEKFNDFPTEQFTIEMWIKNMKDLDDSDYNMHAFEWGREWDLVFKVLDDRWSPRLGEKVLGGSGTVGTPIKQEWAHIAWVWDGGTPGSTDTGNVRIYQNGVLVGTYNADIGSRSKSGYTNPPEVLPEGDLWPLAIGEGLHGFTLNSYINGEVKIQGVPWKGNIAEMRIWDISRTGDDIANNNRRRLSGSEPGLVSYYKFNEGSGNTAKDFNTSRSADKRNDATIYGIGNKGTLWKTELVKYPITSDDDNPPSINVPPGEDVVYYKILSCGSGPDGQIIPLELVVSAPVQKGDVGDGLIALTEEDLNSLTGQEGTPLKTPLNTYIGQDGTAGDIKIQTKDNTNTNFYVFKRALEQCDNANSFTDFSASSSYDEGDCAKYQNKLYYLEKDDGKAAGDDFSEDDWSEVLGSGCDGVQFTTSSGDNSYGHYYKYFSTAPNVTSGSGDLGYNGDSIDWWEAKRRAEQSTCGGMRGYLVSIESAAENEFIKDAVMCNSSTQAGCTGVTPFHVAAGETRANYYGTRLDGASDQHYIWLSNSDWRNPTNNATNMQSESGPLMGMAVSYVNWQNDEPNSDGEPYADMEINRSGRTNGKWNDLRRIPNCNDGAGLDCITGYIVEYGGFDHFKLDHDINQDGDTNDTIAGVAEVDYSDHNFCVARATIEKDTYVAPRDLNSDGDTNDEFEKEDFLKLDKTAEDYPSAITGEGSQTVDYPGWNAETGVLTLVHSEKPTDWSSATNYNANTFVWFNNRVWKNTSGGTITGGPTLNLQQTPTIFNPQVWTMYEGDESDAPCADIDVWEQAFESIKYFNSKEVDAEDGENPYANEGSDGTDGTNNDDDEESTPSLGERTILFSLGPLHVNEHRDGYNHFYEFYQFPARPEGTAVAQQNLYNNNNRRMNEAFSLSRQLDYFGKSGYLATITSEAEDDIITEKAVGNGWMGGLGLSDDSNSNADLNKCGGFRQRSSRAEATADFRALRDFENIPMYRGGEDYGSSVSYVRNIVEKYTSAGKSPRTITAISKANPAVITTSGNHNLTNDDIIKIADISAGNQMELDGMTQFSTGFYRVRNASSNSFSLVDLDTRANINSSSFSDYTASTAQMWVIEGIQNEFYRKSSNITNANNNPQSQSGLTLFYKDPKIALSTNAPVPQTGNRTKLFFNASFSNVDDSVADTECPVWRWMTGPEGMLWDGRGLAFSPTRASDQTPSANNGTWTRANPAGQQIGEVFVDGMPYRNWNGTWEPNNVSETEHGIHLLGTHFPDDQELTWNDLHNWDASYSDNNLYSIRGLILEYGGMENDEDPIIRIATKRVIKLYDRRVTKAIVKIESGSQTGDKLVAGTTELTDLGLSASGNETSEVTITGDATCKNYLDLIKSMYFEHNASTAGTREIYVQLGDVEKPTGAQHYYQLKDNGLSYNQADFQSSYQNLCGIQGYLANVTTAADLTAIESLGASNGSQAWVNGTDECQGGIFRSGFWRYTSGPWKDKEFWRLRLDIDLDDADDIETNLVNQSSCGVTTLRSTQPSVRVGPFEANNWINNHPAANTNNFLAFQQTNSATTTGILTRNGMASSDVDGYIVRFGGSVGDFTGADIEEDGNEIDVILGPIRAEVSFYTDGSDNSIYIPSEDSVDVNTTGDNTLSTGWTKTTNFASNTNPTAMVITPPTAQVITIEKWREELAKVFYESLDTDDFTPGNRKILVRLVYGDTSLNQEIGIVKAIGSRNVVTVTPISWNNR
ncbi:LamG-like jellyroll fold domain-containing protein [Candidatus Pelagibacter sp.]|uniref:LamG-like jellyroll fold domain-containing protein n=1 Tax=Candidatus Pelagibacter sp. TaxID=2024849 RepID=UPI003F85E785